MSGHPLVRVLARSLAKRGVERDVAPKRV
jgi:hypothetical protein